MRASGSNSPIGLVMLLLLIPRAGMASAVKALKVTVLSTMLADAGFGEWGYAALVEVDGKRILFDTGANPDTVLKLILHCSR